MNTPLLNPYADHKTKNKISQKSIIKTTNRIKFRQNPFNRTFSVFNSCLRFNWRSEGYLFNEMRQLLAVR
jgi:hypothetical protein